MSRQLKKLASLVSEIEEIQRQGKGKGASLFVSSNNAPAEPIEPEIFKPSTVTAPIIEESSVVAAHVSPIEEREERQTVESIATVHAFPASASHSETPVAVAPAASAAAESQVSMQLTGNVAVKLRLEESDEIIEVRRVGDHLAISFADGKSVHLPLKLVA